MPPPNTGTHFDCHHHHHHHYYYFHHTSCRTPCRTATSASVFAMLYLLDYGAGNVRSLSNAIRKLGYDFEWVKSPADLDKASALLFPGVGSFEHAMHTLHEQGYVEPLRSYAASGRPLMGICIGMQAFFEGSDEGSGEAQGLGLIPGRVQRFSPSDSLLGQKTVPHMGWNRAVPVPRDLVGHDVAKRYALAGAGTGIGTGSTEGRGADLYFVHSYRVAYDAEQHAEWALTLTRYGDETFVSSVAKNNIFGCQFHPEKSSAAGLAVVRAWLDQAVGPAAQQLAAMNKGRAAPFTPVTSKITSPRDVLSLPALQQAAGLTKRVVACLDVRSNDAGDLVVTKGESYDVREKTQEAGVRNLGKPVELAHRYYLEGADEIVFLNITSFRASPLADQPMLAVLQLAASECFVPLTIGGGIKDFVEPGSGAVRSAKEVANAYFRAGADKVSIGSEAVTAVEELLARSATLGTVTSDPLSVPSQALTGTTGIEQISEAYGAQAVVVSVDPRRVYLGPEEAAPAAHTGCVVHGAAGSEDEGKAWWYRCTIKGGREDRDIDVVQLARGVARLGAGELLVNSIDRDGSAKGFDRQLIDLVRRAAPIPVVASSGAGAAQHFADIFRYLPLREGERPSSVEAALAAGIFHRHEVQIEDVKALLAQDGFPIRESSATDGAAGIVEKATQEQGIELA